MNFLFAPSRGPAARVAQAVSWGLVAVLVAGLFTFAFNQLHYGWNWPAIWTYRQKFLQGWLVTVAISAASLAASLLIGLITALARRSAFLPLRYTAALYVESIRGTPLLVQILILFYVVANAFGIENRYLVGILALSLFAGAYLSEMIRAAPVIRAKADNPRLMKEIGAWVDAFEHLGVAAVGQYLGHRFAEALAAGDRQKVALALGAGDRPEIAIGQDGGFFQHDARYGKRLVGGEAQGNGTWSSGFRRHLL